MRLCSRVVRIAFLASAAIGLSLTIGCQLGQPGLGDRLVAHAALINSTGLIPSEAMRDINVRAEIPQGWDMMPAESNPLYTHRQWRSPNHTIGVGVVYIHMPLPMSAQALVWFAKQQYADMNSRQHKTDGQLLGEWTDSIGREWFEGENDKYHVKGYVVTCGFDAWAVYTGYRAKSKPNKIELNLATRGMESIVPLPLENQERGRPSRYARR